MDYQKAWQRFIKELEKKTSWGRNELKDLMIECLSNPDKGDH